MASQLDHSEHSPSNITLPVCLLAHDMDAPSNVGSLFRIADALGIRGIYLSGSSPVPPNHKIRKTSRSTEKYVPFYYCKNPKDHIQSLRLEGFKMIALEITSDSIPLHELQITSQDKVCLILGSENFGVNEEILSMAESHIHIPMLGRNSSMNVTHAAAIAAYEVSRKLDSSIK